MKTILIIARAWKAFATSWRNPSRQAPQTARGFACIRFFSRSRPKKFAAEAFAKALPALHLCAIETGLVAVTFELSCFCFSQSEFFKEVGEPAVEDSPVMPEHADLGFWIADRVQAAQGEPAEPIGVELIPRDPERRLMAHFLSQLMLRFVWLHEFYHGVNGHSDCQTAL